MGIDIFLSVVRDRVGVIKTKTLITDMQMTYFNSWSHVMEPPQFFIFCKWHVNEAWRQNFSKVIGKENREKIKMQLYDLAEERNILVLAMDDENASSFLKYFENKYSKNAQRWAYCYRDNAGINTNMHEEVWHREFKRTIARREKIQTLYQCLWYLT